MLELNNIHKGDCTQLMRLIPDNSIDCMLTDPPYLYLKGHKLDRPFDETGFFNEAKRVLKKDGFIVLFGRGTSFYRWNTRLADLGFSFKEEVVWDKQCSTSPVLRLTRVHETISIHTKRNGSINKVKVPYLEMKKHDISAICDDVKRLSTILGNQKELNAVLSYLENGSPYIENEVRRSKSITIADNSTRKTNVNCMVMQMVKDGCVEKSIIRTPYDRFSRIHPTQKPIKLLERLLSIVTNEGDVVLDPFSGSGATAIACINSGRNYIGVEIDDEYYNGSKKRIHDHLKTVDRQTKLAI